MKYFVLLLFLFSFGLNAQVINFPDQNFKNKLLQADINNQIAGWTKIDTNNNGEIEESEALQVTYLFLFNSSISNIEGIEYFTSLEYLYVHNNSLTSINLSNLTSLTQFRCNNNNLSDLDLTGLTALVGINLMSNNFSSLNTQSLPNLNDVYCTQNQISSLDFSNNPQLTRLYCSNNNLTSLTIKNGINQDFSNVNFNDCWKTGNPNLTTICADESEIASVQSFLEDCGSPQTISVNSNCNLSSEEFTKNQITIYPNPVNDVLNINLENSIISSVTVFNTLGQKVYFSFSTTSQIDVSKLEAGAYFLKVDGLEGEYYGRFVKK
ncbi:T9SS type A sorting domain-containing protein [Flavobacterium piscinae]|uniref:T9SS type A sorting domain-containing protein n=1 Tax=Flavobacterium piscinae TaxID=2506424 RepID=A0A4Q1KUZ6_9FLAO|nr:T9SS type A sorting domain-containing protein [Flavobacterium piscinae]MBC8883701.1 T9SS type A sorting domain-containing protein [Flavobacterium piscinae]RXR33585.1 T9SS type A sorting domain-containing protein [Flavobacterium piscinae]